MDGFVKRNISEERGDVIPTLTSVTLACCHLHQRVEEHKHSVIGKHLRDVHGVTHNNLINNFKS